MAQDSASFQYNSVVYFSAQKLSYSLLQPNARDIMSLSNSAIRGDTFTH